MSLICDETGKDIEYGDTLMAGARKDVNFYSALSQEVLTKISKSKRRSYPCSLCDNGVNIHEATSSRNFNGSYTIIDFKLGKFLFSISEKTAKKYLPKHIQRYPKYSHPKFKDN